MGHGAHSRKSFDGSLVAVALCVLCNNFRLPSGLRTDRYDLSFWPPITNPYHLTASITPMPSFPTIFRNSSSSPSSCICAVLAGSEDIYWDDVSSSVVATVYETIHIQQNSTSRATSTAYNSDWNGGDRYITNGTGTVSDGGDIL